MGLKDQHARIYEAYQIKQAQAIGATIIPLKADRYKSKLERNYAHTYLDPLLHAGHIRSWSYECLRFRLGEGAMFCPDFLVILPDDVHEIHEVKGGFCREAALVRFKVARDMYPSFKWKMIVRENGQWLSKKV